MPKRPMPPYVQIGVKKTWFVASMLDPRFKKLEFKGDAMITPAVRRDAEKWLREEFDKN